LRAPRRERRVLSPKAAVLVVAADKPAVAANLLAAAKLLADTAHKVLRDKAGKALAATAMADRAIDPCHGGGCNSGEHGNHGAPVPSFAQFAENEQSPFGFADRGHHHFEMMWHHG
jgi:hypothetical protein